MPYKYLRQGWKACQIDKVHYQLKCRVWSAISVSNSKMVSLLEIDHTKYITQSYSVTQEQEVETGKRADVHGIASSIQYYKCFGDCLQKENSIWTWKMFTPLNSKRARRSTDETLRERLAEKKRAYPLLLGQEVDKQVRACMNSFWVSIVTLLPIQPCNWMHWRHTCSKE